MIHNAISPYILSRNSDYFDHPIHVSHKHIDIHMIHFALINTLQFRNSKQLIMAPSSSPLPSSDPVLPDLDKKVPLSEKSKIKKGGDFLDLVVKYGHGEEAFADTFGGATKLKNKVRTVIGKVAVGLDGKPTVRWAKIPLAKKLAIISMLHKAAPWLKNFDDCWAAEWLLSRAINQRVTNENRAPKKRRHDEMIMQLAQSTAQSTAQSAPQRSSQSPPPLDPSLSPLNPSSSLPPSSPPSSPPPDPAAVPCPVLLPPNDINQQIQLLQAQLNSLIQQQQQINRPAEVEKEVTATTPTPIIVSDHGNEKVTLPEMEVIGRSGNRGRKNMRRKGASKVYQEAIRIERETEDEREERRMRKASKRQRKQTTGEELDGVLTELGMIKKE